MAPFIYLPFTMFVAEHGLDHFDLSMRAQYELTKRFSAEASIRPYIARDPERAFRFLETWAVDSNAHVRRLVSEGTRLRLPWAPRIAWLDGHPERVIALIARLRDDPSTMVRRSVANNLNDLGKVRPELLSKTARAWLVGASAERRALVEHALRSAVKRGDAGALTVLGFHGQPRVALSDVAITPRRVAIGGGVTVTFTLASASRRRQTLLVDFAVHFVKARGTASKVFKLRRVVLGPGEVAVFTKRVSLAVHTTRTPRPGRHQVDVIVNGRPRRLGAFDLTAAK